MHCILNTEPLQHFSLIFQRRVKFQGMRQTARTDIHVEYRPTDCLAEFQVACRSKSVSKSHTTMAIRLPRTYISVNNKLLLDSEVIVCAVINFQQAI